MNNKPTPTRKPKTLYNQAILRELQKKYDVGLNYVRQSITGYRSGTLSIKIAEDYKMMEKAATAAIKETLKS